MGVMMQFVIIGKDAKDSEALSRRMAVRDAHIERAIAAYESGSLLYACGIKDAGNLVGSVMIYEFPDQQALDHYLQDEPYVKNNVWQDLEIKEAGVPAFFMK